MFFEMTKEWKFLDRGWASELPFTSMNSLLCFQMTRECIFLVTPWAAKWFLTSVSILTFLQITNQFEQLNDISLAWINLFYLKWQRSENFLLQAELSFTSINSLLFFQMTRECEFLLTPWAFCSKLWLKQNF